MIVDLIVHNGTIHTQDPDRPTVDALAVLGGRVVAIGADCGGLDSRDHLDLRGRVALPGFGDAHAHSVWFGLTLTETDLSGVGSLDEVYDRLAGAAGNGPDGWLVASGLNPVLLGGRHPDRDVLDRVTGGRPLWIKHASGHSCQLNGAGLARIGIGDSPDAGVAPEGGRVVLDPAGRPTGMLEERAMALVRDLLLPYPIDALEHALDLATAQYAREGLTSVTDAGVAAGWIGNAPAELLAYQRAAEHGLLRTRMQVMPTIDALEGIPGAADEPARRGFGAGIRTGWGDDRVRLGPVKVFTDGSILGRTALMTEPYLGTGEGTIEGSGENPSGGAGDRGYLQQDPVVMREQVLEAYAAGWSLALHAVGDAALDLALDLIDEAVGRHGRYRVPNRVEHGSVVRPDQVDRLARLGVPCVVQPAFIPTFGEGMRRAVGARRADWSHRAASLIDTGLPLAFSSDRPVAPGAPLRGIQAFAERLTEEGLPYGPDERIDVAAAVRAATEGTARVTGLDDDRGRLVPGRLADLVVLAEHPAEVAVGEIGAIPVLATVVGGSFTYRSADV